MTNLSCIHLVDGEKGGVGKSIVSQAMFYYCLKVLGLAGQNKKSLSDVESAIILGDKIRRESQDSFNPYSIKSQSKSQLENDDDVDVLDLKYPHIPLLLIDADRSNPDVKNVYLDNYEDLIVEGFFSESSKEKTDSHVIFEAAMGRVIIVNVPSSAKRAIDSWLDINDLFGLAECLSEPVRFVKWFVTNGQKDSLDLYVDSFNGYSDKMTHILVKNNYFCDDWSLLNNPLYLEVVNKSIVLDFPGLDEDYSTAIRNEKLDYDDAIGGAGYFRGKLIARHALTVFIKRFSVAFEGSKQFDSLLGFSKLNNLLIENVNSVQPRATLP